jgi:hypothetical protein
VIVRRAVTDPTAPQQHEERPGRDGHAFDPETTRAIELGNGAANTKNDGDPADRVG